MRKKKSKIYFGQETEQAIKKYLKEDDPTEKKRIYIEEIAPAFSKLAENIVNMPQFNFKQIDHFQTLHNDVMAHLYSNLKRFNPRKLSKKTRKRVKAFSYFGTIAKNYLIQELTKRNKTILLEDERTEEGNPTMEIPMPDETSTEELREFLCVLQESFEGRLHTFNPDRRKIADAIIFFLKNVDTFSVWNKKHFYHLLKEFTGLNPKKITHYLNEFREDYEKLRKQYYDGDV